MDPKNEASLAAISEQNAGLPDWRSVGRNFTRIFRKPRASRWELKVPDLLTLIAAKNASFVAISGESVTRRKWIRK